LSCGAFFLIGKESISSPLGEVMADLRGVDRVSKGMEWKKQFHE